MVPKMLLQPLAENAILHGLSGVSAGQLLVTARETDEKLLEIRVCDNGCGLPPELLGPYRPPEQPTGHLGLLNVDTILRKHYGERFGLRLENREDGIGACVVACLPIEAVDLIGDARKIYVIGGRSCSTLASFLNYYLSYIFDDVRLIRSDSVTESIEEIHRIGEQDVILAISFPRYSVKTIQTVSFAKNRKAKIIAITDGEQSPLAKYADCSIYAGSDMVSFVDSLVAPLSVVNALLAALSMRYKDSVTDTMLSMESIWNTMNEYERID